MHDEPNYRDPRTTPVGDARRTATPSSLWILSLILLLLAAYYIAPPLVQRITYSLTKGRTQAYREQLVSTTQPHNRFTEVARVVEPAVVEVRVLKEVARRPGWHPFFGDGIAPDRRVQSGLGSGFVVDADNGYILTNAHVVAGADQIQVVLADGRGVQTRWVRADPQTDIAVLKVDADNLIEVPLGDSQEMEVGDWVLAIGAPEGLDKTVTAGIISAKGRTTGDAESYQDFLQTDAAINPGNSGGPLVNMAGQVIGINTAIVSPTGAYAGIGFAIPSNMARDVMSQLVEQGEVIRGYIGVTIQSVTPGLARSFNLPSMDGALVSSVVPGGPAERAGLQPGDFIVSVAGRVVRNPNDLRNTVATLSPGQSVPVEFYRNGQRQKVRVGIERLPEQVPMAGTPELQDPAGQLGLQVAPVSPRLARQYGYRRVPQGVIVTQVTPNSPADLAGVREGMIIAQVNAVTVTSPEEFEQAIVQQGQQGVRLRVVDPSGRSAFLFVGPSQ